jgi:hypothetical protein
MVEVGKCYRAKFKGFVGANQVEVDCIFVIDTILANGFSYNTIFQPEEPQFTIRILRTNYVYPEIMGVQTMSSPLMKEAVPFNRNELIIAKDVEDWLK